jgi:hypothetical protein
MAAALLNELHVLVSILLVDFGGDDRSSSLANRLAMARPHPVSLRVLEQCESSS